MASCAHFISSLASPETSKRPTGHEEGWGELGNLDKHIWNVKGEFLNYLINVRTLEVVDDRVQQRLSHCPRTRACFGDSTSCKKPSCPPSLLRWSSQTSQNPEPRWQGAQTTEKPRFLELPLHWQDMKLRKNALLCFPVPKVCKMLTKSKLRWDSDKLMNK